MAQHLSWEVRGLGTGGRFVSDGSKDVHYVFCHHSRKFCQNVVHLTGFFFLYSFYCYVYYFMKDCKMELFSDMKELSPVGSHMFPVYLLMSCSSVKQFSVLFWTVCLHVWHVSASSFSEMNSYYYHSNSFLSPCSCLQSSSTLPSSCFSWSDCSFHYILHLLQCKPIFFFFYELYRFRIWVVMALFLSLCQDSHHSYQLTR